MPYNRPRAVPDLGALDGVLGAMRPVRAGGSYSSITGGQQYFADLLVKHIHSPNIPSEAHMVDLMRKAAERIPAERLWVNPDCGLKTRQWDEVVPALTGMVSAAKTLRETVA